MGIGISVSARGDEPRIVEVYEDTPAQRAGLRSGDVIVAINDQPVAGMALEELRAPEQKEIADIVDRLQSELFNLGGQLDTPDAAAAPKEVLRIQKEDVVRLEAEIDRFTSELPPMRYFILPGGSRPGAALHLCRTVCRRAERKAVALSRTEALPEYALPYLNRLSDLLFVMARAANLRAGGREVPWKSG